MQEIMLFLSAHWMLSVSFFALSAMLSWTFIAPSVRGFQELKPAEAVRIVNNEEALILDVRSENEFQSGHVTKAINIPLQVLSGRIGELEKYKDKPVLAMCRSGNRSSSACAILRKQGFTNVTNLAGGIMAWQHDSFPLTKKKK